MTAYMYFSLIPEALIVSMLPPEQFGQYYATGHKYKSKGQAIIQMSGNHVLIRLAENLFTHMRMIRRQTIGEEDRVERSIHDHMNIIQALEARDTERAEDLVRQHALGLGEHVSKHVDYLD